MGLYKVGLRQGGVDGFFAISEGGKHLALGRVVEMFVTLSAQKSVYKVPSTAIYGENRIYIAKDHRLQGITVKRVGTISHKDGSYDILIKSPELKDGMSIVTTQLANARTGLSVRTTPSEPYAKTNKPKL